MLSCLRCLSIVDVHYKHELIHEWTFDKRNERLLEFRRLEKTVTTLLS